MKVSMHSFLRWAGGKRLIISRLIKYLPPDVAKMTYYEPFLGAGSMYFAIQPKRAILSDLNASIIRCFKYIKNDCDNVSKYLCNLIRKNDAGTYYKARTTYNKSYFGPAQAARFIYLNHTSYNGIFRVNKKGEYNVPYGYRKTPQFPSRKDLQTISKALRNAILMQVDYQEALQFVKKGDFVYLDPPYPPLNGTSYFTHYTEGRFTILEQIQLANIVNKLAETGCLFMMSNADTPFIRELYKKYILHDISVTRYVTCKQVKHRVSELVITNYDTRWK